MPLRIKSLADYHTAYKQSITDPNSFWGDIAEHFTWRKKWDQVSDWTFKDLHVEWFKGAQLNITENCLDRHLADKGNQPALIWEPNNPENPTRSFTYKELHQEVCRTAQMLLDNGVKKGDRVCIYMGMIPELTFAVLACARIGAIHSVIFGGFSAQSIADRVIDAGATFVITCDGAVRGPREIHLKAIIDEALEQIDIVKKVFVYKHLDAEITMQPGRDIWWHDHIDSDVVDVPAAVMDSEDTLFILYTSGSTGKPKGVVHTCGGYMVYATYTFLNVFPENPAIGWTGHGRKPQWVIDWLAQGKALDELRADAAALTAA